MRLNSLHLSAGAAHAQVQAIPAHATAQQRVEIKVAATTDVHGRLVGWDYAAAAPDSGRGLARAATIVDSLRRAAPRRVLLVDAGDLLQGNAMTYVAGRVDSLAPSPVIAAMNAMQYDAAAIGNHEYNYGVDNFDRAIAQARFPFLAANARRLDGHTPYPGRVILTRAGVRIAVIGVTNPGAMVWDRDHLRDRVVIEDIVAALPEQIRAARAEGADAVVVVAHAGLGEVSSYDTLVTGMPSENPMARVARDVPGIDLIVIGHSHREVADTLINGVRVIQARQWAGSVAVATLVLERAGDAWRVTATRGEVVPTRGHAERRDVVRAVARAHEAAVRYSAARIGATTSRWTSDSARLIDTPILDLIQAVQRQVSGAELSVASAFGLTARFDPGPITVEKVLPLYPYENTLRALRLSGAQVRAFLEHSARYWVVQRAADGTLRFAPNASIPGYNYDILAGLDYTIDLSRPVGSRIATLEKNGVPVADTGEGGDHGQYEQDGFVMMHGSSPDEDASAPGCTAPVAFMRPCARTASRPPQVERTGCEATQSNARAMGIAR
jgi:2',3'-cyclic-nucleotide 2'-phosphodiesterase/3'-nucleotidase